MQKLVDVEPVARIHRRTAPTLHRKNFLCLLRLFAAIYFSVKPLTSYTCKLTDEQASALDAALRARNWKPRTVPYARFAFESDKTNIVFYESGKLVVQGKGTQEFIEFVLEPEILKQAKLGYETVLNPELLLPRIGVDESGKGDFFGPLCIAGVYINESVIKAWQDARHPRFQEHFQRQKNLRTGGKNPQNARLRGERRADWQRGLQPALREDEKRERDAGVGPRARD